MCVGSAQGRTKRDTQRVLWVPLKLGPGPVGGWVGGWALGGRWLPLPQASLWGRRSESCCRRQCCAGHLTGR